MSRAFGARWPGIELAVRILRGRDVAMLAGAVGIPKTRRIALGLEPSNMVNDTVLNLLCETETPINRQNYLELSFLGDVPEIDGEMEALIAEALQEVEDAPLVEPDVVHRVELIVTPEMKEQSRMRSRVRRRLKQT